MGPVRLRTNTSGAGPASVLIVAFGSYGDVLPFIGLGAELVRRGHAVMLAAPPAFETHARGAGVPFRPLGAEAWFEAANADAQLWDAKAGARILFDLALRLARPAHAMTIDAHAAAQARGERLITVASTLSFGPRLARDTHGARVLTAHLSPFLMRSRTAPPVLPGLDLPVWLPAIATYAIQRAVDRFVVDPGRLPALNAYRAELGLTPLPRLTDWLPSPDGVLLMVPPWFAPPQRDWAAGTRQSGFPRGDRFGDSTVLSTDLRAFLAAGPAPIAVTYGSSMRHGGAFFAAAAEACSRLGRRGILVTARPEQVPSALPDGVVHAPYAPFSTLLPACAGLIHHGGIGTLAEALAAGVPQVIVPNAFDQFDNAARIVRLNVGARLDRTGLGAQALADTMARLLFDPVVAESCLRVRAAMALEDGVAAACDAIEAAA